MKQDRTQSHYIRLICHEGCGEVYLTRPQYLQQMKDPNRGWRCPSCGCYPCGFDDEFYEQPLVKEETKA